MRARETSWKLCGLDLPEVLRKVYRDNAARVVKGLPKAATSLPARYLPDLRSRKRPSHPTRCCSAQVQARNLFVRARCARLEAGNYLAAPLLLQAP